MPHHSIVNAGCYSDIRDNERVSDVHSLYNFKPFGISASCNGNVFLDNEFAGIYCLCHVGLLFMVSKVSSRVSCHSFAFGSVSLVKSTALNLAPGAGQALNRRTLL